MKLNSQANRKNGVKQQRREMTAIYNEACSKSETQLFNEALCYNKQTEEMNLNSK